MSRPKNRRRHQQGIDFVVGYLRDVINDPKTSPLTRLRAIDRLAVIDDIYEVPLGEAGQFFTRQIPKVELKAVEDVMSEEEKAANELDQRAKEALEKHRTSEGEADANQLSDN